jgi:hypothetical protein
MHELIVLQTGKDLKKKNFKFPEICIPASTLNLITEYKILNENFLR